MILTNKTKEVAKEHYFPVQQEGRSTQSFPSSLLRCKFRAAFSSLLIVNERLVPFLPGGKYLYYFYICS